MWPDLQVGYTDAYIFSCLGVWVQGAQVSQTCKAPEQFSVPLFHACFWFTFVSFCIMLKKLSNILIIQTFHSVLSHQRFLIVSKHVHWWKHIHFSTCTLQLAITTLHSTDIGADPKGLQRTCRQGQSHLTANRNGHSNTKDIFKPSSPQFFNCCRPHSVKFHPTSVPSRSVASWSCNILLIRTGVVRVPLQGRIE